MTCHGRTECRCCDLRTAGRAGAAANSNSISLREGQGPPPPPPCGGEGHARSGRIPRLWSWGRSQVERARCARHRSCVLLEHRGERPPRYLVFILGPHGDLDLVYSCSFAMERMNVDGVSESFADLGIAAAKEDSQRPSDAPPPESPGRKRHTSATTFLSLPWLVKWHVYTHLPSRDCIALSSTCREMYGFNTFAYTHLQFLPPNSLFSLACSVVQLAGALARSPHYCKAVRTIRIVGWTTMGVPESCNRKAVYRALDEGVASLLNNAPHLYALTLDLNLTRVINYFPHVFAALTRVRTIRDLRLAMFLVPVETDPALENVPEQTSLACERVCLNVYTSGWLPVMMRDPRNLRWFGLTVLDKVRKPGDFNWAMTLHHVAEMATELETLVLNNPNSFDANALGQIFQLGLDRGVLGKLRSISVNTTALSVSDLRQLFSAFSRSFVTHLRIVVNHYGRWLEDFGPQYISELSKLVPNLEEISLDQLGMVKAMPLPGKLGAWGEAFRSFKKLRRIVFASMFVLDLWGPRPADDEEDYEEEGEQTGEDEEAGMDVDDGVDEGDEWHESNDEETDDAPHETLESNLVHLAAWTDMFLDDHLRMPAPFATIWFLDPRFPGCTAAGFDQRVMEGEGIGGRAEHMIFYPIRKRDGWWWDEQESNPLD
ncbi:hypothetical protein F5148DRAFT_1172853 [Russula earlei]|uniref:Uncharacterized protein n=1 Tax=Russula earlei TaxID=71964 RepID=A0ACC0UIU3_9AGAM|nr:hypothetical protein F5148DRAFT_1172853 [Russula earlei]